MPPASSLREEAQGAFVFVWSYPSSGGVSLAFDSWRLNLRSSNTEPLLRLNVESRHLPELVAQRVSEIEQLIC